MAIIGKEHGNSLPGPAGEAALTEARRKIDRPIRKIDRLVTFVGQKACTGIMIRTNPGNTVTLS